MTRAYGQFCGVARAVEMVGERWALLILRDLTVGPRRFTDLSRGLPGIPTNILTVRLKELEQAGVVQRRILPRPEAAIVYELTAYGHELEDIVLRLGRWGSRSLGKPRPGEVITRDSLIVALRTTFRPEFAHRARVKFELRVGEIVLHACVVDGVLESGQGPVADPDLIIDSQQGLKALLAGDVGPSEALITGALRITGERALLDRFVEMFHMPGASEPARA